MVMVTLLVGLRATIHLSFTQYGDHYLTTLWFAVLL